MIDLRWLGPLTKGQVEELKQQVKEKKMKERTIGDHMAAGKTTEDLAQPWTYWGFKEGCPVSGDTKVDAIFNDGTDVKDTLAASLNWTHVIDYRKHLPPKIDVAGWIRWDGAAHSPVRPMTIVETVGLNGTHTGPAGRIVNWQQIKKYRVLSEPNTPIKHTDPNYWFLEKANDVQEGGTHYKDAWIQPWEVIDTWPIEQQVGYHRGNVLKYIMRMGSKDERLKEVKKAAHYAQKLVEVLSK